MDIEEEAELNQPSTSGAGLKKNVWKEKASKMKIPSDFEDEVTDIEYYAFLFLTAYGGYVHLKGDWRVSPSARKYRNGMNKILQNNGLTMGMICSIWDTIGELQIESSYSGPVRETSVFQVQFDNPSNIQKYWEFDRTIEPWVIQYKPEKNQFVISETESESRKKEKSKSGKIFNYPTENDIFCGQSEEGLELSKLWSNPDPLRSLVLRVTTTTDTGEIITSCHTMISCDKMLPELICSKKKYMKLIGNPQKLFAKLKLHYIGFQLFHVEEACKFISKHLPCDDIPKFPEDLKEDLFSVCEDYIQRWLEALESVANEIEVGMNEENPELQDKKPKAGKVFGSILRNVMISRELPEISELFPSLNVVIYKGELVDDELANCNFRGGKQRPTVVWEISQAITDRDWDKAGQILGCLPIDYAYKMPYYEGLSRNFQATFTNNFNIRKQFRAYVPLFWRLGVYLIISNSLEEGNSWEEIGQKLMKLYSVFDNRIDMYPIRKMERLLDLQHLFSCRKEWKELLDNTVLLRPLRLNFTRAENREVDLSINGVESWLSYMTWKEARKKFEEEEEETELGSDFHIDNVQNDLKRLGHRAARLLLKIAYDVELGGWHYLELAIEIMVKEDLGGEEPDEVLLDWVEHSPCDIPLVYFFLCQLKCTKQAQMLLKQLRKNQSLSWGDEFWVEYCRAEEENIQTEKIDDNYILLKKHLDLIKVLLNFLDYGKNLNHSEAWKRLHQHLTAFMDLNPKVGKIEKLMELKNTWKERKEVWINYTKKKKSTVAGDNEIENITNQVLKILNDL